jgi:mono/diheme cytochrome c family protein
MIARGKYLATAGDCVACHTAPGGKPFAGGQYMPTPFGAISTPNITPDKETGIGNWTDDAFYRAMHEGIGARGEYLYPVFPFPWFTKVMRDDVLAIKAYLFSLPPVHAPRQPLKLAFPFNVRDALAGWRLAFFKPGEFKPDPGKSESVNRGAYLVQGLGHCGECHNSHNMFGASNWSGRLEGGEIEGWYAPNLTDNPHEGIGAWSVAQLAQYLKDGAAPGKGVVLGPMHDTINDSLSHLTDADLTAIAGFLKSVPAKASYQQATAAPGSQTVAAGADTYTSFCASCHQQNGQGKSGEVVPLAGNGAVMSQGPENVIRVVLGGLKAQHGLAPMPAVGVGMTDQQIADVVNYVRESWGNNAPATVGPGAVGALRKVTQTLLADNLPNGCPAVEPPTLAQAVAQPEVAAALQRITLANMLEQIDAVLPKVKTADRTASDDDIVNALTVAYCPIAALDSTLPAAERAIQLGTFAQLVYGQIKQAPASTAGAPAGGG